VAHAELVERRRQVALADRQAQLTAAMFLQAEDYTPIDVEEQVSAWEGWLVHDPTAPPKPGESFADRVAAFERQVQELDRMTEVA
jgi:hypothetical protein